MILILLMLFSFQSFADCYIRPDLNDPLIRVVDCSNRRPPKSICKIKDASALASEYDIEIITPSDSMLNIGGILDDSRPWTPNEVLDADKREFIRCTLNASKKQARLDAEAIARQAQEQARAGRAGARDRLRIKCGNAQDPMWIDWCESEGLR